MSLESFFITQGVQVSRPAAKEAGSSSVSNPAALPGATNFIDFLFTRVSDSGEPHKDKKPLTAENSPVISTPKLKITDILADNKDIAAQSDRDTENFSLDLLTQIANVLAMNQQALKDQAVHDNRLNTLPPEEQKVALQNLMQKFNIPENTSASQALKLVITQLKELATDGDPAAITANLTPEQINALEAFTNNLDVSDVSAELTETQKDELHEANEVLLALGFCQVIIPPPKGLPTIKGPTLVAPEVAPAATPETDKTKNDLAAKLNNLIVGEEGADGFDADAQFKSIMQKVSNYKPNTEMNDALSSNTDKSSSTPPATASALPAWMMPANTALLSPALWTDAPYDIAGLQAITVQTSSAGQMTNLVTQAHSASQPLAATQAIAITLQKQAASGENRNFTLQLDPPELGRVEVRMEFAKDKSVKTHMIIEKPETLAMMQRDAHNLERALQASGVEAGGDTSLSFELASQDHDFHQNGGHDNHSGSASGSKQIDTTELPIETTMTWQVDPDTGHMRYRITA